MTDDIDYLAAAMYAGGADPYSLAETEFDVLSTARATMRQRAANGVPPLAGWQDTSDASVVRKLLARLINAGWRPPSPDEVRAAVERYEAVKARFDAWWSSLSRADRDRAMEQYDRTETFPDDLQPPSAHDLAEASS